MDFMFRERIDVNRMTDIILNTQIIGFSIVGGGGGGWSVNRLLRVRLFMSIIFNYIYKIDF